MEQFIYSPQSFQHIWTEPLWTISVVAFLDYVGRVVKGEI
jgi:hypothetical protein